MDDSLPEFPSELIDAAREVAKMLDEPRAGGILARFPAVVREWCEADRERLEAAVNARREFDEAIVEKLQGRRSDNVEDRARAYFELEATAIADKRKPASAREEYVRVPQIPLQTGLVEDDHVLLIPSYSPTPCL